MNNNCIYIKDGSKSYWINVLEVLYVKASGNYIDIYTKFCNYKTVRLQIGQFYSKVEELQVHHDLVRIDRSTILNIRLVEFINPKKNTITLRNSCYNLSILSCGSFIHFMNGLLQLTKSLSKSVTSCNISNISGLCITSKLDTTDINRSTTYSTVSLIETYNNLVVISSQIVVKSINCSCSCSNASCRCGKAILCKYWSW